MLNKHEWPVDLIEMNTKKTSTPDLRNTTKCINSDCFSRTSNKIPSCDSPLVLVSLNQFTSDARVFNGFSCCCHKMEHQCTYQHQDIRAINKFPLMHQSFSSSIYVRIEKRDNKRFRKILSRLKVRKGKLQKEKTGFSSRNWREPLKFPFYSVCFHPKNGTNFPRNF